MKFVTKFTILLCFFTIIACGNKQSESDREMKEINNAYIEIDKLDEKVATDSNYKKSSNYGADIEKAQIELAKKTKDLSKVDKLLLEYEMALNNLKTVTDKSKQSNDLLKDKEFTSTVELKATRVREFQQELKKLQLNPEQLKRFNQLSSQ